MKVLESRIASKLEIPIGKSSVIEFSENCLQDPATLSVFFNLMTHANPSIGFRASWVLETVSLKNLNALLPILKDLLVLFPNLKIPACQRHLSRILILLNKKGTASPIKQLYLEQDLQPIVETLFSWLVEPTTPVAVKANCMEALTGFIPDFPWIKEELLETIDYLSSRETVAFFGRLKKVRPQLKRFNSLHELNHKS